MLVYNEENREIVKINYIRDGEDRSEQTYLSWENSPRRLPDALPDDELTEEIWWLIAASEPIYVMEPAAIDWWRQTFSDLEEVDARMAAMVEAGHSLEDIQAAINGAWSGADLGAYYDAAMGALDEIA